MQLHVNVVCAAAAACVAAAAAVRTMHGAIAAVPASAAVTFGSGPVQ